MTHQEYVLSKYPEADGHGPVKLYWPGQGERSRFVISGSPAMSFHIGEGNSLEDAWEAAAFKLHCKEHPDLTNQLMEHIEMCERCTAAREVHDVRKGCAFAQDILGMILAT